MGSLENKRSKGRWTIHDITRLTLLIKRNRKCSLKNICSDFNTGRALPFSKLTIRRHLKSIGFVRRVAKNYRHIRKINRQKRIQYCKTKKSWTIQKWKKVIFTDESMIIIGKYEKLYIWRKKQEKLAAENCCPVERRKISTISGSSIFTNIY